MLSFAVYCHHFEDQDKKIRRNSDIYTAIHWKHECQSIKLLYLWMYASKSLIRSQFVVVYVYVFFFQTYQATKWQTLLTNDFFFQQKRDSLVVTSDRFLLNFNDVFHFSFCAARVRILRRWLMKCIQKTVQMWHIHTGHRHTAMIG